MAAHKVSEIKFTIELDEQNIPEKMNWQASDGDDRAHDCNAIMLSIWDRAEQNTLRIDLWTKDMRVDEMDNHFIQSLLLMAESYQRATKNPFVTEEMKRFCKSLVKQISEYEQARNQS